MQRREFLRKLGLGLISGWALSHFPCLNWSSARGADRSALRLAYLSDAHLIDGDQGRPQAQALTRAVAEINALRPRPDLVLFGGDLAHQGHPEGLKLGHQILSSLQAPLRLVMGEHDGLPHPGQPWPRWFGSPQFSFVFRGVHFLGLHTVWQADQHGSGVFRVGRAQQQWLAAELSGMPRSTPLVICSHAPLYLLYKPWYYYTEDGPEVLDRFAGFDRVTFIHGHVHHDLHIQQHCWTFQGMPALAWPRPDVRQGTPAQFPPDLAVPSEQGHHGCGWGLVTLNPEGVPTATSYLWRA